MDRLMHSISTDYDLHATEGFWSTGACSRKGGEERGGGGGGGGGGTEGLKQIVEI